MDKEVRSRSAEQGNTAALCAGPRFGAEARATGPHRTGGGAFPECSLLESPGM